MRDWILLNTSTKNKNKKLELYNILFYSIILFDHYFENIVYSVFNWILRFIDWNA